MPIFKKNKKQNLSYQIQKYEKLNKILEDKINYYNNLTDDQFLNFEFNKLLNDWKSILKKEYDSYLQKLKETSVIEARNFLWEALSQINIDDYKDDYIYKIKCNSDETKSRLIGLNGRNKKAFEKTCGLELIVNKNDDEIKISCTNLIKKELAARLLNKLCNTKNIEPNKIKNYYCEIKNSFDIELVNLGKEIINKNFNISFSSDSIYHDIALMKYRMSYGQNLLEHSIECAKLAIMIAKKLDLDSNLALQCAFFHDIGKVLENEKLDKNHVDLGVEWAKKNNFNEIIINSIAAHHGNTTVNSIYAVITKYVDEISASREGARKNSSDTFVERVKLYENICYQFPEVKDCWVLNTGFLIKIIVKPNLVKDDELELLGIRIKKAFEDNDITKMYNITLELIKENTFKIKTKKNL